MQIEALNNLIVILLFGGLLMSAFLSMLNRHKVNRKANAWFAIFLLLWASFWMEEIVIVSGFGTPGEYFTAIVHYLQVYLPFVFYQSVVFYINPNFSFRLRDTIHLIVPALCLVISLVGMFDGHANEKTIEGLFGGLTIFQSILYTVLALRKIRIHQKKIPLFSSDTKEIDLSWLEYIILTLLAVSLLFVGYSFINNASKPDIYINSIMLIVVLFTAHHSLKQKEIYPVNKDEREELIAFTEEPVTDARRKVIADEDIVTWKQKLTGLMIHGKPYLDSELNLVKLADMLSLSPHQLSYLINTGFEENFFSYINNYRVDKAKELLLNTAKNNLTILGIAFESGFNSKTSFNTTFKKITGQTPSEYKRTRSGL